MESLINKLKSYFTNNKKQTFEDIVKYSNDFGTEYIDRTIYYIKDVELDNHLIRSEVRVFALAGSYLSKRVLKEALEIENKFRDLNDNLRKQMKIDRIEWRIKKEDQSALEIYGVTKNYDK